MGSGIQTLEIHSRKTNNGHIFKGIRRGEARMKPTFQGHLGRGWCNSAGVLYI
jgi:hypothetical protein